MRKFQKKQAEKFIALVRDAHAEIKKALGSKNYALAMDLLEQCQGGMIELGRTIESTEGENCTVIPKLERYCEQAYQAYEQVRLFSSANSQVSSHKLIKLLNKSLTQVENSVKNDLPTQIEAVFLPYKASMWDSLESVWKAADEDPNCNAYVIPIPYYDRDPDGNFSELHYEGDQYPKYVPITNYNEYDFAGKHPDIIFIHNPYDNNNYVTSVHPFFYSDKLKEYTDQLVYIPYFVLGEVDLDNEEAVKKMAHFVTTPGVINADKVIVQSENMRQAYIKVMVTVTGEHTRKYWEEKILGLGSPKMDKVLSTCKEDVEVPEEWLKVIEKPDGSWKKIIFYNTSVAALLEHNEKMNAKIKDVLQVFKENQEEVALLWRPHPLIEATIKSVRPRLWEEYKEIVDTYRTEGWGIYDDTADMDRAVVLSDAYYGDGSSIVQLYKHTNKPCVMQNIKIVDNNNEKKSVKILTLGAYTNGLSCWLPSKEVNALFHLDLITRKIKYLGIFPNVLNDEACNIYKAIFYRDEIYFFARYVYKLWTLNIHTNKINSYCYHSDKIQSIRTIEKIHDKVWIFSDSCKDPIVCFDLKNKKSEIIKWKSENCKDLKDSFFSRAVKKDENLYLATREKNGTRIFSINCIEKSIICICINTIYYVNCLTIEKNNLWMLGMNSCGKTVLQKYNIKTWLKEKEIELSETEKAEGEGTKILKYFEMIVFRNRIFLIPALARTIVVYDILTDKEKKLKYPLSFHWEEKRMYSIFAQTEQIGEKLYFYPFLVEKLLILDMQKLKFEEVETICDVKEFNKKYINFISNNQLIVYENKNTSLNDLLNYIINEKLENSEIIKEKCGESICYRLKAFLMI